MGAENCTKGPLYLHLPEPGVIGIFDETRTVRIADVYENGSNYPFDEACMFAAAPLMMEALSAIVDCCRRNDDIGLAEAVSQGKAALMWMEEVAR